MRAGRRRACACLASTLIPIWKALFDLSSAFITSKIISDSHLS